METFWNDFPECSIFVDKPILLGDSDIAKFTQICKKIYLHSSHGMIFDLRLDGHRATFMARELSYLLL